MIVYIPTRGRVGLNKQVTLRELLAKSSIRPWLVCPWEERIKHMEYYDNVFGCPRDGIGATRHWIMNMTADPNVVMLDDDMYFQCRSNGPGTLVVPDSIDPMFEWIQKQFDEGYVHGGISARQGNNFWNPPIKIVGRVNNAHFMDAKVFAGECCSFEALSVMEDFFVTLTLLTLGYPNIISYNWCWNQRGSGTIGGCSEYRTLELQAEGAYGLRNAFPNFVKVVEKIATSGGSVFKGIARKDVVVSWKRAYCSNEANRRLYK